MGRIFPLKKERLHLPYGPGNCGEPKNERATHQRHWNAKDKIATACEEKEERERRMRQNNIMKEEMERTREKRKERDIIQGELKKKQER